MSHLPEYPTSGGEDKELAIPALENLVATSVAESAALVVFVNVKPLMVTEASIARPVMVCVTKGNESGKSNFRGIAIFVRAMTSPMPSLPGSKSSVGASIGR
jgi:hypothetical protein